MTSDEKRIALLVDALCLTQRRKRRALGKWEVLLTEPEMAQIQSVLSAELSRGKVQIGRALES